MPYRRFAPLRSWTLRSSPFFRLICAAPSVLALMVASITIASLLHRMPVAMALLSTIPALAVLFIVGPTVGNGLIHSGRGELRLFSDRIEVTRARRPGVDVFALRRLSVNVDATVLQVLFVPLNEITTLDLRAGGKHRRLPHAVFRSRAVLDEVAKSIRDLQDVQGARGALASSEGDSPLLRA